VEGHPRLAHEPGAVTGYRPRRTSNELRTVEANPSLLGRAAQIWRFRELLKNLIGKELRLKYKNSVLGYAWSLLNPVLYLVVFYFVFQVIFGTALPDFPIFLLTGLLTWNLFAGALSAATASVLDNGGMVTQVAFPREVLPLAAVGAALVNFFLQTGVLLVGVAVAGHGPSPEFLPVALLALVVVALLAAGLGLSLAALNVQYRDTGYLLELVLLAWFWATPIVYQHRLMTDELGRASWVSFLNPMTPLVITVQRAIYNRTEVVNGSGTTGILYDESVWWYLRNVLIVGVGAVVLIALGLWVFDRIGDDLAEQL
jgi:ABC-2 type transport system permease protein